MGDVIVVYGNNGNNKKICFLVGTSTKKNFRMEMSDTHSISMMI